MSQGLINPLCNPFGNQWVLLFVAYYLPTRARHKLPYRPALNRAFAVH